ncbi:hypothetical protein SAMN05192551_103105 [Tindallia magadiensis]|uniref:Uncharacterized protein n=1 Tax=Tindallia magadiensis TaxID=69895 RepID=A0A1I3D1K9_9FIRM|nr:hypothetical protein [Tindallia magadiensis]SFH80419.1 hypothetical protein SAMN05192551_103105 [Tindallia magadiensis]
MGARKNRASLSSKNKYGSFYHKAVTWLLVVAIAIVPLIVRLRVVQLDDITKLHWFSVVNADYFAFYKMVVLLMVAIPLLYFLTRSTWPKDKISLAYYSLITLFLYY